MSGICWTESGGECCSRGCQGGEEKHFADVFASDGPGGVEDVRSLRGQQGNGIGQDGVGDDGHL